jgi:hypothetical protein
MIAIAARNAHSDVTFSAETPIKPQPRASLSAILQLRSGHIGMEAA